MANITDAINEFKTAPNGESVRSAFVEVMTRVNDDNIKIGSDYLQVIDAAGHVGSAVSAASASATLAASKATEASNAASVASGHAVTATTKAGEAATSATNAINAKDISVTKAGEATTAAATSVSIRDELSPQLTTIDQKVLAATDAATLAVSSKDVAVTKAGEASSSATLALGYKNETLTARDLAVGAKNAAELAEDNAKASETNSKTSENNSKASETNSKTSENNSKASELASKTSETNSATKASEANISAINALSAKIASETAKTQTQAIHDAAVLAMAGTTNLTEINDARRGQASLGQKIDLIDVAIADIRSRDKSPKEYGVRIYDNQSSTTLERILDSVGMVANAAIGTGSVVNDFDTADGWPRRRTVNGYYDETSKKFIVTAAKGEPNFKTDGTNGNVWVETECFYVKRTVGAGYIDWSICTQQLPGYTIHSKFKGLDNEELEFGYAASYEVGTDVNGNPTSISGVNPTNGSHDSLLTLARKLGTRYHMDDSPDIDMIQLMIEIEFAQRSSQAAIGQGICSLNYGNASSLATVAETAVNRVILANAQANLFVVGQIIIIGTTNDANNVANLRKVLSIDVYDASNKALTFDGTAVNIAVGNFVTSRMTRTGETDTITASSGTLVNDGKHAVIYRGTENPFGNGFKVVTDLVFDNNPSQIYICRDPRKRVVGMSVLTADYKPIGYLTALTNGYATSVGYDPNYQSVRLTTAVGGSSATYLADYFYRNPVATIGLREVLNGGDFTSGAFGGCSYWHLGNALAGSDFYIAGRLSFTG